LPRAQRAPTFAKVWHFFALKC